VGPRPLIDWLANRARSYVFSTAPPEAVAAAALQALRIVRAEPDRRIGLLSRAERLRERLLAQEWRVGASRSQIIPLMIGEADETMRLARLLRERGLLVPGIRPPSVPLGESLLRISLTCAHTDEMIGRLVDALGQLKKRG
jgi:8-amino-7-oxononanoate synthase